MAASSINKIHVATSTGLSLNERFTAIATKTVAVANRQRSRSRSRSRGREVQKANPQTSMANRRLLQQLARRHKMTAAMKLKRRSMRTMGAATANGNPRVMKRGSVQAFRVAPNGRAIKANTMARNATMTADYITNRSRPLRRANSISNRVGRPPVGGAAERVAKRRLERLAGDGGGRNSRFAPRQGRSRSRSRSRSRARMPRDNAVVGPNVQRGRSRSRSRARTGATNNVRRVPIRARLGVRPGAAKAQGGRGANMAQRGVANGRVERRRGPNGARQPLEQRGRSRSRNRANINDGGRVRARSRQRRGSVGQPQKGQQQQQQKQQNGGRVARSRSRPQRQRQQQVQRNGQRPRNAKFTQNKANGGNKPVAQRQGRSRSRGTRNNGGPNLGNKNSKANPVKKEDLDNELDQYMSTTKSDGELDYLLKN